MPLWLRLMLAAADVGCRRSIRRHLAGTQAAGAGTPTRVSAARGWCGQLHGVTSSLPSSQSLFPYALVPSLHQEPRFAGMAVLRRCICDTGAGRGVGNGGRFGKERARACHAKERRGAAWQPAPFVQRPTYTVPSAPVRRPRSVPSHLDGVRGAVGAMAEHLQSRLSKVGSGERRRRGGRGNGALHGHGLVGRDRHRLHGRPWCLRRTRRAKVVTALDRLRGALGIELLLLRSHRRALELVKG
eukprot:350436-Chlamydomonas_euryale.AAC.11